MKNAGAKGLLLTTALAGLPGLVAAQSLEITPGGDLGIDCDVPRHTADGFLIIDRWGRGQALCEADRATALNYASLLETVRDRVVRAIDVMPPPLMNDLIAHLEAGSAVADWRPSSAAQQYIAAYAPGHANEDWFTASVAYWGNGVLDGTGIVPSDWGISSAICGTRDTRGGGTWQVLVWMEPANLGERWTPGMVQRAVTAWFDDRDGESAVERAPAVTSGDAAAPVLLRTDGGEIALEDCFGSVSGGPWTDDEPHLATQERVSARPERETRLHACADPDQVGYTEETLLELSGVYVDADGTPITLDQHGDPANDGWFVSEDTCRDPRERDVLEVVDCNQLIDFDQDFIARYGTAAQIFRFRERRAPLTADPEDQVQVVMLPINDDGSWTEVGRTQTPQPNPAVSFCDPEGLPNTPGGEVTETTFDVDDCPTTHGTVFPSGTRTGRRVQYDFPDSWPVSDYTEEWIEDLCWKRLDDEEFYREYGECPTPQEGFIRWERVLERYRINWADPTINRYWQTESDTGWVDVDNWCHVFTQWTETETSETSCMTLERDVVWETKDYVRDDLYTDVLRYREVSAPSWQVITNTCPTGGSGGGRIDNEDGGGRGVDLDGDGRADVSLNGNTADQGDIVDTRDNESLPNSVNDWTERNARNGGDDRGGGGLGGGCFLTTAVVERRGEADDGPTLTALRHFRDDWMASHPDGARLIAEYYAAAPALVAAIPHDHADWAWIEVQIDRAVSEIDLDCPEAALATYCAMVRRLMADWLPSNDAASPPPVSTAPASCSAQSAVLSRAHPL